MTCEIQDTPVRQLLSWMSNLGRHAPGLEAWKRPAARIGVLAHHRVVKTLMDEVGMSSSIDESILKAGGKISAENAATYPNLTLQWLFIFPQDPLYAEALHLW